MKRSTNDVARLTGASLRQLQWWDEIGLTRVAKNGHAREYTDTDTLRVLVIAELRRYRIVPERARSVLKFLESVGFRSGVLVTSIRRHSIVRNLADAVEFSKSVGEPVQLVDLRGLKRIVKLQQAREVTGRGN